MPEANLRHAKAAHHHSGPGPALARLRKANGWTLSTVSRKTGVAVSTLSKIENNQTSPSYHVLMRLANGLGVDFVSFLDGRFTDFAPGSRSITRARDGVHYDTPLGQYEALSTELGNKAMEPMLVRVTLRTAPPPAERSTHGGEEFLYVLSGQVEFLMEPYTPVLLAAGDSVHFDGSMPHCCVAVGDADPLVLSVCYSANGRAVRMPREVAGRYLREVKADD